MDSLTQSQEVLLNSEKPRRLIFGSRQVGHTTAIALDAIESATQHQRVIIATTTHREATRIATILRELATERGVALDTNTKTSIELENGARIDIRRMDETLIDEIEDPNNQGPDHICLDSVDYIKPEYVDSIRRLGVSITAGGTPRVSSPNIRRLAESPHWYSIYQSAHTADHITDESIESYGNQLAPSQYLTEIKGYFVTDARELADVYPAEE